MNQGGTILCTFAIVFSRRDIERLRRPIRYERYTMKYNCGFMRLYKWFLVVCPLLLDPLLITLNIFTLYGTNM